MSNVIESSKIAENFKIENIHFTVSSRGIRRDVDIFNYLKIFFMYVPIAQIESVFGFVNDFSPLYGGRGFSQSFAMTPSHIEDLESKDIRISLTLTNHTFTEEHYQDSLELLKMHHKKGNSIVCVNDDLARRIRKDFPKYVLKASLIKNLNTLEKVSQALKLYDKVVIPMDMNDDDAFLLSLPSKERIVLFANANCAYNCSARICYNTISHSIVGTRTDTMHSCSKDIIPRLDMGHTFFDIAKFHKMGFSHFKLVPNLNENALNVARMVSNSKNYYLNTIKKNKRVSYLFSYPKSGRTWLRFLVANYLNLAYDLNMKLDLNSMFTLLPNDNDSIVQGVPSYDFTQDKRFPMLLFSHDMQKDFSTEPCILLLRLVYDVVVSDYFQHVHRLKTYEGTISQFIREEKGSLSRYCNYINYWADLITSKKIDKPLVITYETLHENTQETLLKVLSFLGVTPKQNLLKDSVKLSTFENMKKSELEEGLGGYEKKELPKDGYRMREGKVANYRTHLSDLDIKHIVEVCNEKLTNDAKRVLHINSIDFTAK